MCVTVMYRLRCKIQPFTTTKGFNKIYYPYYGRNTFIILLILILFPLSETVQVKGVRVKKYFISCYEVCNTVLAILSNNIFGI